MRGLHICSQLCKSRTNKNPFKMVSCLSSCGKKKKKLSSWNSLQLPKQRRNHQNHKLVTKFSGLPEKVETKRDKRGFHRWDRSQKSPDNHIHTHIKPIWKSKWKHMWEELKQIFMLSYKFHFDLLRNIQIKVLRKFFPDRSRHMRRGLLLFYGGESPGEFLFSQTCCLTLNNYPQRGRWGKKICAITAAWNNRISLLAWRRCRQ